MSFNWEDYLTLADALSRQPDHPGPEEASLRSAVSRAYYAVFGIAREIASARGLPLSNDPSDHQRVIRYFRRSGSGVESQIGRLLEELRDRRNQADYELTLNGVVGVAHNAVMNANRAMGLLKRLK